MQKIKEFFNLKNAQWGRKIKSFFQCKRSRKSKIISGVAVAAICIVMIFGWQQFFAFAQSVIDGFTDSSKVSATWRTFVDTTNHHVTLAQKTCDNGTWNCAANNICPDLMGDGAYLVVMKWDVGSTAYKNANTACDQPQCGLDGGQSDNLVVDNTVDFSNYPARNYCKSIGGRLPNIAEMQCVWTNRASFGNNFGMTQYWSATEYNTAEAYYSTSGGSTHYNKTSTSNGSQIYVRCVMGW